MIATEKKLDDTDKKIIELLSAGHKSHEIATKIWIGKKAIYHRLYVMRKHFECKTTSQLVAHLYKKGLV